MPVRTRRSATAGAPDAAPQRPAETGTTRGPRRRVEPTATVAASPDEQCRRLEQRVRSHIKQLRYLLTFLEAYEAEGWRRASREKLKPNRELAAARRKISKSKRGIVDALQAMGELRSRDPPIPYLVEMEAQLTSGGQLSHEEYIYCSRCSSTETTEDNDILLCDNEGCCRAFHQLCQVPAVRTDEIPEGDEPWFCASCLAVFNALKCINNACETQYEKIEDVFPGLAEEEHESADESAVTAEEDEDDEDDDDFVASDLSTDYSTGSEKSDPSGECEETPGESLAVEVDVSDEELRHLHAEDVIDPKRRSMRSQGGAHTKRSGLLGKRVVKQLEDSSVVRGVIVEVDSDAERRESIHKWRVVFDDGSVDILDDADAMKAAALVPEEEKARCREDEREVDTSLIVAGKRKRSRVDYRALNDLLFQGKADSDANDGSASEEGDAEEEALQPDANNDDDYAPSPTAVSSSPVEEHTTKRGRRQRPRVDYRLLHEGISSD